MVSGLPANVSDNKTSEGRVSSNDSDYLAVKARSRVSAGAMAGLPISRSNDEASGGRQSYISGKFPAWKILIPTRSFSGFQPTRTLRGVFFLAETFGLFFQCRSINAVLFIAPMLSGEYKQKGEMYDAVSFVLISYRRLRDWVGIRYILIFSRRIRLWAIHQRRLK